MSLMAEFESKQEEDVSLWLTTRHEVASDWTPPSVDRCLPRTVYRGHRPLLVSVSGTTLSNHTLIHVICCLTVQ